MTRFDKGIVQVVINNESFYDDISSIKKGYFIAREFVASNIGKFNE